MAEITGAVIARDEGVRIGACLESLRWTDDLLVLIDSRTTDDTEVVARRYTDNVHVHDFANFASQRNQALDLIRTPWVLFLDADERVLPNLAREIRETLRSADDKPAVGYWIPRRNMIWKKWIRHGGWYPDHQLRLLRADRARYDEAREVHELVVLDGPAGYVSSPMIHNNYDTIRQFLDKQDAYSDLDAGMMHRQGIRAKRRAFVLQPLREFRRRYFQLGGFRDGPHGFLLAALLAYNSYQIYRKLRALSKGVPTVAGIGASQ